MTTTTAQSSLFAPFRLGPLTLPNRMVMAPMTRGRAEADGTPTAIMVPYYERRADAGLLITEGVFISPTGRGWSGAHR
jgi:N-ethylmaleimide reductase